MYYYSVIIPHHNCPDLLRRLIDSIPEREDIQIVVVDDASDPQVVDFSNYKFPKNRNIEFYQVPKNESRWGGHARNVGIEHAKGKWLLFADSDDFYTKEAFDILDKYLNSEYDVVYYNCKSVNSKTLEPADRTNHINDMISNYLKNPREEELNSLKYNAHEPWNKLINRSFLSKYGIRFEEVKKGNDILFTFMVGYFSRNTTVESEYVYVCTFRDESITYSINKIEYAERRYEFGLSRNYFFKTFSLDYLLGSDFINILRITKSIPTQDWIKYWMLLLRDWKRLCVNKTKYVDTVLEIQQRIGQPVKERC